MSHLAEPHNKRYPFWPIFTPWLIIAVMIIAVCLFFSKAEVSCHYAGDILTPAAKDAKDKADEAKSKEGIGVTQDAPAPAIEEPKKKVSHSYPFVPAVPK